VTRPASGAERHVRAKSETWHLTLWHGEGDSDPDAVAVEVERHRHNFHPTLTAKEAGALIDALLELLPAARGHSKLADSRDRKARQRAPRST
jgi:hypothetical protein